MLLALETWAAEPPWALRPLETGVKGCVSADAGWSQGECHLPKSPSSLASSQEAHGNALGGTREPWCVAVMFWVR